KGLQKEGFAQRRDIRIDLARSGWGLVEDGISQFGGISGVERGPSCGNFVEYRSGRVNVAARVVGFAAQLFRRHIRKRSSESLVPFRMFGRLRYGQAEVENLEPPVGRQDQISGFEIAMEDALCVGGLQA